MEITRLTFTYTTARNGAINTWIADGFNTYFLICETEAGVFQLYEGDERLGADFSSRQAAIAHANHIHGWAIREYIEENLDPWVNFN